MNNSSAANPKSSSNAVVINEKKSPLWQWIISIAVPLMILIIPETAGLTYTLKMFFALTFWAVFCMATEIIPSAIVTMILPVFYIIFNVAKADAVFRPWMTSVIWVALGGMIIARVLMTTGLAKRIAYFAILKSGGTFKGTLIGLMVAGIIINPFVPTVMGKMALIIPVGLGICQALDLEPQTRGASAVMIAAFLAIATPRMGYLTGDGGILMALNMVADITNSPVSWSQYAFHNLFMSLIFSAISIAILIFVLKPEKEIVSKDALVEKYKELGQMSKGEKKIGILLLIAIMALLTDSIHHINSAWIFMMLGGICFLPGINLMDDEQLGKLNYKMLFFVAGCMSIGTVAGASGAGKWIANLFLPYLQGGPLYTVCSVWLFGVVANFCLTPLAAIASFTVPITELAVQSGLDPLPIIYTFLQGLDQYILPYEFAPLLFIYSFGYISLRSLIKVIAPRMLLNAVFIIVIAYPYWKFIGLF